jgi:hypothetical protein
MGSNPQPFCLFMRILCKMGYFINPLFAMQKKILPVILSLTIILAAGWLFFREKKTSSSVSIRQFEEDEEDEAAAEKEEMAQREFFVKERLQYEFDMLKDPVTGMIPRDVYDKELVQARTIPLKEYEQDPLAIISSPNSPNSPASPQGNNTYTAAGPNNQGGRTRAMVFDKRFNGSSNQVMIAGSVSGGIFRSADGGGTWIKVTPLNEIHNVTSIAQDIRAGFENTWYAGGGEALGNSAAATGAFYYGFGILKSTDNGVTWTRLTLAINDINGTPLVTGTLEAFDNAFDIVHKIAVNPANGDVYICGHRRLIRSTDGGTSFNVVFTGTAASTADGGQMDIVCSNTGKIYLGVNGGFSDLANRGLWTSATGDANSWTRIAGGQTLGVDSMLNWRGNSYDLIQAPSNYVSKRIVLALAPSNQNILYACYENGLSQESAKGAHPETDLFKFDFGAGGSTNLSANMPDFPGQLDGIDPIAVQGGYDLLLAVKPDDPNTVFIGGTNLYRSTDGFATTANTEWIGGYGKSASSVVFNLPTHPDIHALVFDPTNPKRAVCANDGGIQVVNDITGAVPLPWVNLNNYQTLQYYHVAIDPATGQNNFIGGAQDNGTYFRQAGGATPDNHFKILSGDGGASAIASVSGAAFTLYGSSQTGTIYRDLTNTFTNIKPSNSEMTPNPSGGFGEFVTYFKMDFDNPEDIYYVNYNKIFRTKNASTVTAAGWEYLPGVANAVNSASPNGTNIGIRALELSRGAYFPSHTLYIGTTSGKVFRLDNPQNADPAAAPADITPPGLTGSVSSISANPNNDEEILVTVSNYAVTSVFWTNNAKSSSPTWKNAEGDLTLPSFRSCMIIVKKDVSNTPVQEYYVGTSVGLYSATNINQTLTTGGTINWVREGGSLLNFAIIQSLSYRPQDNTLLLGTHGNGMYFTNTGTPNFQPNQNTGINDPVRNDKNFIQKAYPTITTNHIDFRIGNMLTIQKIVVMVYSVSGQLVYRKEEGYTDGTIDVSRLAKGPYVLTITSSDYKQQFIQQFIKN